MPEPAKRLDTLTNAEARRELFEDQAADMARWARPDLIKPAPLPAHWALPVDLDEVLRTRDDKDPNDLSTP